MKKIFVVSFILLGIILFFIQNTSCGMKVSNIVVTPSDTLSVSSTKETTRDIQPAQSSTPIPRIIWEKIVMIVNGDALQKNIQIEVCSSFCSLEEIEDRLGKVEEWKIVKDSSNLYFHSGTGSLGEEFLLLYKSNLLQVGNNIYIRDGIIEKKYIIAEILELDRKFVSENELFSFENNYEDQLVLVTCSERNTPWIKFTSKLVIQLKPDIDPEG